jgi:hypothetical protein
MSGRLDSNQRPPEPHSGALAKLRHAPVGMRKSFRDPRLSHAELYRAVAAFSRRESESNTVIETGVEIIPTAGLMAPDPVADVANE